MQATVLSMQRKRARNMAPRPVREIREPDGAGKRRPYVDDVAVVVWVIAVVGIVLLCGAVMVLSLISASISVSPRIGGPAVEGGAVSGSDENGVVLVDDDWVYGPKLTR